MTEKCKCVKCTSLSGNGHVTQKPCPENFKRKGEVCLWENPNLSTPSSLSSTDFPAPKIPITKKPNRLNRQKSLTELFGGPF